MNNTPAPRLRGPWWSGGDTMGRRGARLVVLGVLLSLLANGAAHAQTRENTPPQGPTVADADQRIAALSSSSLSETERAAVKAIYEEARDLLRQAQNNIEQIRRMRETEQGAPQLVADMQRRLKVADKPAEPLEKSSTTLAELQGKLRSLRADRDELQARLSQARNTVEVLNAAPIELRERYAAAERELERERAPVDEVIASPDTTLPSTAAQATQRARIFLSKARRRALELNAERLRTERLTLGARILVAGARQDRLSRDLSVAQTAVEVLEKAVGEKQEQEAQSTQLQAQRTEAQAQGKAPAMQLAASENTALANELAELVSVQGDVTQELAAAQQRLQRLEDDYQRAQQRVTLARLSGVIGQVLREQRRNLPNLRSMRGRAHEREEALAKVGLAQLRIEENLREIVEPDAYFETLIQRSTPAGAVAMDAGDRRKLQQQLAPLLEDRRDLLLKLRSTYLVQLKLLGEFEFAEQRLLERSGEYAKFLGEKLLWIPSVKPLDLHALASIAPAALWLVDADNLVRLGRAVEEQLLNGPLAMGLLLIAIGLLIWMRQNLRGQLAMTAKAVRYVYTDRFSHTLRCAAATLLLAMPPALVAAFFGWNLARYGGGNVYVDAVSGGLWAIAMPLFLMRLFRYIFAADGLGVAHFRWSEALSAKIRRYFGLLLWTVVPGVFIVRTMEAQPLVDYQAGLGRCTFLLFVLVIAWVGHRLFHPSQGDFEPFLAQVRDHWVGRLRHLWYAIMVGVPLVICGLALYGYYYTALRLFEHEIATVRLLIGSVLLFHLVLRALVVARRKLALAQTEAQPTMELSADGSPVRLDVPNIDINTIDTQTRNLAGVLIGWGAVFGFYIIWADVLPALVVLDDVVLWDSSTTLDGATTVQHITLASLGLSVVFGIVFAVAARNLPGVLEIGVLRRLPLDAGARYAITTLSQYAILTIGSIIIFQSLGVGWGQIQWLVAALSVGLGFGLQEIFANFISGIMILFERPVRIGDTVSIGEITGTVSRIRIRATTLTDWDNKEIIIPNKSFITEKLVNWTLSDSIQRVVVNVGVAYGTDTRLAYDVIWNAITSNARVLRVPQPQLFFLGFGDSSLDFEVRVFVGEVADKLKVTHELHMAINEAFNEHGIVIPFPQRDMHIYSAEPNAVKRPPNTTRDVGPEQAAGDAGKDGL